MSYPHSSIWINSREVKITDILSNTARSDSDFERETFSFIKKWLEGVELFTLTTSGSTGTPKEIILTRNQLQQSAQRTIRTLKLSANLTAVVCLDTKYIAGKMMLVRAFEANMKIVAVEPVSNPLQQLAPDRPHDFVALVPLQLEAIVNDPTSLQKLYSFSIIILGGAAVSESLKSKIITLPCTVCATYGMTETVSHIALKLLNGAAPARHFETLPGVKIKSDERNCLVIELPDFNTPIVTNDIVNIINDSSFDVIGRYDTIINSGGVKLIPETIEKKLSPILKQPFFVSGITDERLGQKLILVVEGHAQPGLMAALRPALSAYEIPKEIFYVDQFVRTETQKINRLKTVEKALKSV